MTNKFTNLLNTTKKKAGAALACSVLLTAVGTATVFAAPSMDSKEVQEEECLMQVEDGIASYSIDGGQTWNEGLLPAESSEEYLLICTGTLLEIDSGDSFMVQNENGVMRYSVDGGQTWNEAESGEEGLLTYSIDTLLETDSEDSFMVQNENGVMRYSVDGGQTWSESAPEGVVVTEEDGKVTVQESMTE